MRVGRVSVRLGVGGAKDRSPTQPLPHPAHPPPTPRNWDTLGQSSTHLWHRPTLYILSLNAVHSEQHGLTRGLRVGRRRVMIALGQPGSGAGRASSDNRRLG